MFRDHVQLIGLTVALFLAATPPTAAGGPMPADWVELWRQDLETARSALEDRHPSPYDHVSRGDLDAAFDRLAERMPSLEHHQAVVELAGIVARLGDGHTRLTLPLGPGVEFQQGHSSTPDPALGEMRLHQLPLRLAIDGAGPWVEAIDSRHRELLGARLVAVGDHPIADVIAAVSPTIRRDNEMQVLHHLPMHLVLPEILHACGVIRSPERADLTFERRNGGFQSVTLAAVPFGEDVSWADLSSLGLQRPISELHTDRNYALTHLEDSRAIYLQFNEVYDAEGETIRELAARLEATIAAQPVDRLILDLRRNRGGNGSLLQSLEHALYRSPLNRTGHFFVLIGRATFSAAMFLALDLEKNTEAIFVGEPTGSRPNHYGDSRKVQLPHTGLTLRISSLYWQSHPRDERPWIAPQLPVPTAAEDALAGRDPVLDAALQLSPSPQGVDWERLPSWGGEIRTGSSAIPMTLDLRSGPSGTVGSIDIPRFGLEGVEAEELRLGPHEIAFTVTVREGPIRFRGEALGDRIFGLMELGSARYGFFLQSREGGAVRVESDSGPIR